MLFRASALSLLLPANTCNTLVLLFIYVPMGEKYREKDSRAFSEIRPLHPDGRAPVGSLLGHPDLAPARQSFRECDGHRVSCAFCLRHHLVEPAPRTQRRRPIAHTARVHAVCIR